MFHCWVSTSNAECSRGEPAREALQSPAAATDGAMWNLCKYMREMCKCETRNLMLMFLTKKKIFAARAASQDKKTN